MEQEIIVLTTTDNLPAAERIARELTDKRLAACVQIDGPINSVYRWQGKTEAANEWRCTIKSRMDLFEEVAQAIKKIHSYETPEIIAVPVVCGSAAYLQWMKTELMPSKNL